MKKQPANTDAAPLAAGIGLVAFDAVLSEDRPEEPRYWADGTCGNVFVVLRYLGWQLAPIVSLREGTAATALPDAPSIPRLDLPFGGCNSVVSAMSPKLLVLSALLAAHKLSRWRRGEERIDVCVSHVDVQGYMLTGEFSAETNSECHRAWLFGECYATRT